MPLTSLIMLHLKCKFYSWLTASDVAVCVRAYESNLVMPIARYVNGRMIPPEPAPAIPDTLPPDWTEGQGQPASKE